MELFSMEELVIHIISVEDNRNEEIPFKGYRLNFEILYVVTHFTSISCSSEATKGRG